MSDQMHISWHIQMRHMAQTRWDLEFNGIRLQFNPDGQVRGGMLARIDEDDEEPIPLMFVCE